MTVRIDPMLTYFYWLLHIRLLHTDYANCETLEFPSGQEVDISIKDLPQLCIMLASAAILPRLPNPRHPRSSQDCPFALVLGVASPHFSLGLLLLLEFDPHTAVSQQL